MQVSSRPPGHFFHPLLCYCSGLGQSDQDYSTHAAWVSNKISQQCLLRSHSLLCVVKGIGIFHHLQLYHLFKFNLEFICLFNFRKFVLHGHPGQIVWVGDWRGDVERTRFGGEGLSRSMMPKFERLRFLKKFTSRSFFTLVAISDAGSKRGACCTSETSAENRLPIRIVIVRGTDSPFNSLRSNSWDQMASAW